MSKSLFNGASKEAITKVTPDWRVQIVIATLLSTIAIVALFLDNATLAMTVVIILAPPTVVATISNVISFPALLKSMADGRVTIEEWAEIIPNMSRLLKGIESKIKEG